ncbi:phospholipid-transporting ATPase IF-like isoform X3 [Apostichopus japonicus]|uniref:phospholipid-transporting ATPase IF-like isoform X3 n=1 Tax=Stichopus japonicus TaxID=307972 RepID=UPI003AB50E74
MPSFFRRVTDAMGCTQRQMPINRVIFVNHKTQESEGSSPVEVSFNEQQYPDNTVMSSKYTALSFFPKNLFEQFRRIANFYFLCIAILQLTIDSPVAPWTSIVPLVFVVSVTMIKQGYEDILRHRSDKEVNNRPVQVVRNGKRVEVLSKDIRVGDIVWSRSDEELPCDMVLLSSQNPDGECYVTTANLDGETNLKIFRSLPDTAILQDEESLMSLNAEIQCQQPITDLYKFVGRMNIRAPNSQAVLTRSLNAENLLLRGSKVKNTPYVYGVAVYTGEQSKMALNSKKKGQKFSCIEKSMNKYLVAMLVYLAVQTILATGLKYYFNNKANTERSWYFYPSAVQSQDYSGSAGKYFEDFLSFLVLFNYIIPISLYVTLEMQKFTGSTWLGLDIDLYDEVTDQRARANTSDLNEELGQVEYMFTDKTGTLTENEMTFRQCSVRGFKYIEDNRRGLMPSGNEQASKSDVKYFKLAMALCHTVHVSEDVADGRARSNSELRRDYQASSPDEKALVEAANRFGVILIGGTQEYQEILVDNARDKYTILNVLEFDPTRKCMSIILRTPEGKIWMICKGAESTIIHKSTSGPKDEVLQHVNDFAVEGLRTLCYGTRTFSEDEYENLRQMLHNASTALDAREEKLKRVYEQIENNLELIGATGVEDKLQDKVSETIEKLREAGIKIWVLTGDKQETAVNISHSCGHFQPSMRELMLVKQEDPNKCGENLARFAEQMRLDTQSISISYALVVDGPSLQFALDNHEDALRNLSLKCSAVLCCRMSPLQKALVVKLVKASPEKPSTMAIGDGANDVSMIQEAHLGLGIMGKEGRQAVRNSDYAFARFCFLEKLLLVHGHWYYNRIAITVQYFFYKNFAFITAQFYYACFSYFSQQTVFESFYLTIFNITCTALPILIFGIIEQNVKAEDLLANPRLYNRLNRNSTMSLPQCIYWVGLGIWHSLVFFFGFRFLVGEDSSVRPNMQVSGVWTFGTWVYTICVLVVNLKLCIETSYWNVITFVGMFISIFGFPALLSIYSGVLWADKLQISFFDTTTLYFVFFESFKSWSVWFNFLLLTVLAFLPDYIYKAAVLFSQQGPKARRQISSLPYGEKGSYVNRGLDFNEETDGMPRVSNNHNSVGQRNANNDHTMDYQNAKTAKNGGADIPLEDLSPTKN